MFRELRIVRLLGSPPRPGPIAHVVRNGKYPHEVLRLGEIANVCYVRSGRRPSKHTVKRVLAEKPLPRTLRIHASQRAQVLDRDAVLLGQPLGD